MDLTSAIGWLGDYNAVALGGLGGGVLFGAFALTAWIAAMTA